MSLRSSLLPLVFSLGVLLAAPPKGPWTNEQLLAPGELAQTLQSSASKPAIFMVGPRVLYRGAHIRGASFAGPASSAEGLDSLKSQVAGLKKDQQIVLYCGCCPMEKCPNIRPAFAALLEAGFTNVRVLDIPTNLPADWTGKGYPVEKAAAAGL